MRIFSCLILLIAALSVRAQGVHGYVKDEAQRPLSFATIYIQEAGTGTVANENGYYDLSLPPGHYTVIYKYLGHETRTRAVVVGEQPVREDVQLPARTLTLSAVEITEGREDPAYTIMRKAIAKAGYHRQQLDSYKARVYVKGSGRILKTPRLLKDAIESEGVDSTTAFLVESVSEVQYRRPNTYEEKVISIREQGVNNDISPMPYINSSFYEAQVGEAVSPLAPQAFAYYRFELIGSYIEGDIEVNRIKVIPRNPGEGVFEGTIAIIEDWWSIHDLQLSTYKLGIKAHIKQVYAPIEHKVWMPITHQFEIEGKFWGFVFAYNYLATVSNYNIKLNPELETDFKVIDEKIEKEIAAQIEREKKESGQSLSEKLANSEELTTKELRKIMKEYRKTAKENQEQPAVEERRTFKVDSSAYNRDTIFWNEIRPVPLTAYELKSYEKADSIALNKTTDAKDTTGSDVLAPVMVGKSWSPGEASTLGYTSPLLFLNNNTVENYVVAMDVYFKKSWEPGQEIILGGIPRYSFGRHRFYAKGYLNYNFGKNLKKGSLQLRGGRYVSQINEKRPISPLVNGIYTLLLERNYMKIYEKEFLKIHFKQPLADNFSLQVSGEWARRFSLKNIVTKSWIEYAGRSFTPNTPFIEAHNGRQAFGKHEAFLIGGGLEWRPWQRYRIYNDKKEILSKGPIIFTNYRSALADVIGGDVQYHFAEAGLKTEWLLPAGSRIDWNVTAGGFLQNDSLAVPDYQHFSGNRTLFVRADPVANFRLLPYYRYSTDRYFVQSHLHYHFRKLALTQITPLWITGLKENLFLNYLQTPQADNYLEVGYALDNIFKIFRLEVVTSFQSLKYRDFGVLIGFSSSIGNSFDGSDEEEKRGVTIQL